MSTRPNWSRFVLGICLFTFISISFHSVHVYPQGSLASMAEAAVKSSVEQKAEEDLLEELFPYSSRTAPVGFESADLITASTYVFSAHMGVALDDMSSRTTLLGGPTLDHDASPVTNIGFDFWYDGVRHSQFSVNANGLARLGSTVVATTFNNSTSGLNTTTNAPKIAPYFEDMCTGSNGRVHYKVL